MEHEVIEKWGVDHETGKRVDESVFNDLMDALREDPNDEAYEAAVAMAGLRYARELTRDTGGFTKARISKARGQLLETIVQSVREREKQLEKRRAAARETQPAPRDPVYERLFLAELRRRPKSK